jgi:hypothetical protein
VNLTGQLKIDTSLMTGIIAIVFATAAGLLTAAGQEGGPLAGGWYIPPLVAGITAVAALLQKRAGT